MHASVTLGRPFGIPVGIHWSMLVLGALATWSLAAGFEQTLPGYPQGTYWTTSLLVVALFGLSIVAHELAHAVVARRNGLQVDRITLWALGGVSELSEQPATPGVEVRLAAAGPATSLAVGIGFGALALLAHLLTDAGVLVYGLAWLAAVNAVLAVFNVLPARPMDGGRILTGFFWWRSGDRAAAAAKAARVSLAIGWALAGLGLLLVLRGDLSGLWLALVGWLVTGTARVELQLDAWRRAFAHVPVAALMSPPPPAAPEWQPAGAFGAQLTGRMPEPYYVVTAADGTALGVVPFADLRHALGRTPDEPLRSLARPLRRLALAAPGDTLGVALAGPVGVPPVLVVGEGGRVVGQVTVMDLARFAQAHTRRAASETVHSPWPAPTGVPVSTAPPERHDRPLQLH